MQQQFSGKGKLRENLRIGSNKKLFIPNLGDRVVTLVTKEDHHIWGVRYQIQGRTEWFEANCFEYVYGD